LARGLGGGRNLHWVEGNFLKTQGRLARLRGYGGGSFIAGTSLFFETHTFLELKNDMASAAFRPISANGPFRSPPPFPTEKSILLVEDYADDEFLFKHVLKKNSIENPLSVARDGVEAITYLEGIGQYSDRARFPFPGILFLDWNLPGLDGFAVLEWVHRHPAKKKGMLIIMSSQFGNMEQIRLAYSLGATSFIPKPFSQNYMDTLMRHFAGYWIRSDRPAQCA
jgi:two-component system response regulator